MLEGILSKKNLSYNEQKEVVCLDISAMLVLQPVFFFQIFENV